MKSIRSGAIATALLVILVATAAAQTQPKPAAKNTTASVMRKSVDELKALMDTGEVTIVDVRSPVSHQAGHIPGAILLQLPQVSNSLDMLKAATKPIVTYCACNNEHTAAIAAQTLQTAGIEEVYTLRGGWHTWVQQKNPIVKGEKPQ